MLLAFFAKEPFLLLWSELLNFLWRKMAVKSGSSNAKCFDNIGDEQIILRVFKHSLSGADFFICHESWSTANPAIFSG